MERDAHRGGEPAIRLGALGAWWQRYFTDNAAVWLLRRWNTIELQRQFDTRAQLLGRELDRAALQGDHERIRELSAQLAQHVRISPTQTRFWQAGDGQRLQLAYGMAAFLLIAYAVAGPVGLFGMLRGSIAVLAIALSPLHFVPLMYGALLTLLQREHAQGTSAFLRLARLDGWDLLYGAYTTYALAGATRIYLLWGAPFLLVIATVVYDSLLAAIGFCVRAGLCYLGWSLLFQTLVGLLVAPRPTLLWQVVSYTAVVLVGVGSTVGALAFVGLLGDGEMRRLASVSLLVWATRYEFWLSLLFPPIGAMMTPHIVHPLWGVLHGLAAIGLARLLAPLAARRLQRALDAPEPEPKSQEGAWW